MQQRSNGGPTPAMHFLLATVLGVVGMFNLWAGFTGEGAGIVIKGVAMTAYALVLLRDALHIHKTGKPAMPHRRLSLIGLGCLSLYMLGVLIKRGPELAQMVN